MHDILEKERTINGSTCIVKLTASATYSNTIILVPLCLNKTKRCHHEYSTLLSSLAHKFLQTCRLKSS